MKTTLTIVLSSIMGIGLYAIADRTWSAQQEKQSHAQHCNQVNEQVIRESDEVIAKGKFPTQDQTDNWRQLSEPCKEAS